MATQGGLTLIPEKKKGKLTILKGKNETDSMCVVTFFGVDVQTWADVSAYAHMSIALPAGYSALEIVSLMSSVGYMGWLI